MSIARVHTWSAAEILLASDLNAEFNNIIGNGSDLVSPFTKAISIGGFALNFDAANTIAFTATTSGIVLTGGTVREPAEDTITAFATGGQTNATALSAARKFHRVSVCATAGDSYKLPASTAGQCHYVRNDGAAAAQAFGAGTDTINSVATATGIPHPAGVGIWYVCTTAGNWTTGPLVAVSGNFPVTLTATAATNVTLPTSGTLATLAGTESLSGKTYSGTQLTLTAASSKIIPGATSLSLRNNADGADNLLVTDSGNSTVRGSLSWGTGVANFGIVAKRKASDQSVTNSTTLQNDSDLSVTVAANEEWFGRFLMVFNNAAGMNNSGAKMAITVPTGATLKFTTSSLSSDGTTDIQTVSGTAFNYTTAALTAITTDIFEFNFWVANGANAGTIQLQWAQSTASLTALTAQRGSHMTAYRVV